MRIFLGEMLRRIRVRGRELGCRASPEWRGALVAELILYTLRADGCRAQRGMGQAGSRHHERRNVIEDVLDEQDLLLPVRRLSDDGLKAWQQVIEHGYEGLVAKDPQWPYVGGRTLKWLKVKQPH